jgi:hypothetical protein
MLEKDFPRQPKELETEIDAIIKIKDIKELYRLKEYLAVKWWESGLIILLFASGLGFFLTVIRLIPVQEPFLYWFSLFWFAAILLTLIGCIEFLIGKIRVLRRLYEIQTRILTAMQKDIANLKKRFPESPQAKATQSDSDNPHS